MSNRRTFLRNASLFAATGLLAGKGNLIQAAPVQSPVATSAKKELGLQIYSLQKELYDDLPKRMKQLKESGYTKFELAGYDKGKISGVEMAEFKKIAGDNGISIDSSHVMAPLGEGFIFKEYTKALIPQFKEFWKVAADDHAKIGCKYLIQPMMPQCKTIEDASLICEVLNVAGEIAKNAGLQFGYHNHNMEFERLLTEEDKKKEFNFFQKPGTQILDLFMRDTDPSLVVFELDVYWTVMGQNDPVEYMKQNADRIKALHIKDRAVLGQSGMMNFEMIFKQMYANGIKDFFVELEQMPDGRTQFEGITDCATYLQQASFVK
ncbi:sugar phosphate isomerase/epimerase family protein [Massilibacteroides vaginae]|uniref:sugar phosphate isomerase/epimerase family protein n=1 Tax=Massilibacteroides vaginae TaxID=1673718 RepID=UPI000A1CADF3|nr:sugar phosphate isomerase/epimerase [Massilibacteroides vaginae]